MSIFLTKELIGNWIPDILLYLFPYCVSLKEIVDTWIPIINLIINIVLVGGVIAAFFQLRTARQGNKALVLLKLIDEWRSKDLYFEVRYINDLREEWRKKNPDPQSWDQFAEEWVREHSGKNPESLNEQEAKLANEWFMRRKVSQFLAKMGYLMQLGYIKRNDLFGAVPEAGRLLIILIPIEIAIQKQWAGDKDVVVADWDSSVGKWEFNHLWREYLRWYKDERKNLLLMNIEWIKLSQGRRFLFWEIKKPSVNPKILQEAQIQAPQERKGKGNSVRITSESKEQPNETPKDRKKQKEEQKQTEK